MRAVLKIFLSCTAVLFSAVIFQFRSNGATRLTDDFVSLVKQADAIVEVAVHNLQVQPGINFPRTIATVHVNKAFKGELRAGETIEIEMVGGSVGGVSFVSPGQPRIEENSRQILLISRIESSDRWRVIGGDIGQVEVVENVDGKLIARRACGKFEFYVPDKNSASGFKQIRTEVIALDRMRELLRILITTGRPVFERVVAREDARPEVISATAQPLATVAEQPVSWPWQKVMAVIALITAGWAIQRIGRKLRRA